MKTPTPPVAACSEPITISAGRTKGAAKPHRFSLDHVSQGENLTCQHAATLRGMRALLLASACAIVAGSCATPPTVEVVTIAPGEEYRSGAQSYQLSERERILCEQKAASGDIIAAKKLVTYHMMVTVNDKEVRHWLRVVERLQKADSRRVQGG